MDLTTTLLGLNRRALKIMVLICFLLQIQVHIAQPNRIYFDHITTEEGLSQNDINCILQDRNGFMWFGTHDGLNQYDGYQFSVYKPDPADPYSIHSNLIHTLAEDSLGRIWIGTAGSGISMFDPTNQRFTRCKYTPNDSTNPGGYLIRSQLVDDDQRLWVGTSEGLHVFDIQAVPQKGNGYLHNITAEFVPPELKSGRIEVIFQDKDHTIWIGSNRGLFHVIPPKIQQQPCRIEHISIAPSRNPSQIRAINQDKNNRLIIATSSELLYQTQLDAQQHPLFTLLAYGQFVNIEIDDFEQIWVTSQSGLYRFSQLQDSTGLPQLVQRYTNNLEDPHSLNKDVLRSLFLDKNGMVWVGTNGGGVNRFDPGKMTFSHFKKNLNPGSIGYNKIRSIFEDSELNIWIGTEGGGLDFLGAEKDDGAYDQFIHLPQPQNIFAIEEIHEGETKTIYFGAQHNPGLYKVRLPLKGEKNPPLVVSPIPEITSAVFAILKDHQHGLWVGTYNDGLFHMRFNATSGSPDFYRFQHDPQNVGSLSNNIIRSLMQDQHGNIWIGTGHGLNMLPHEESSSHAPTLVHFFHQENDTNSLSHNYILALYESQKGDVWVGTFGQGLNKFVPAKDHVPAHFIRYTEKEGLANNVVKGILEDAQGYLWISTNRGLSRFDPTSETFKNYDTHDGLQGNEFSELACFKRQSGEMLFGGVNGFNAFNPESFQDNSHLPEVVFTGFQVLNKPVSVGEKVNGRVILKQPISETHQLNLRHHENSFSLEFAALHYSAPEKNQYQYKLEGFDESWIPVNAQKRFATYTNLEPGDYTIQVKASNNDGVWNEVPSRISIHISPPIWRTWWAYTFYAALIIFSLIAFRRYTIIGIKEKHDLVLEHLEKEKAEELHQMKLQFFTNISHELRTPLTLISGPLEYLIKAGQGMDYGQREQQYHLIQKNANYLLRLVNQLLDFRKLDQNQMKLQVQRGEVVAFIHEITEPFQFIAQKKHIDFQIVSTEVPIEMWFDPDVVEKSIYNLLSNAFKFTPEYGQITIEIAPHYPDSISKKAKEQQGKLEIKVRDSGPGIPEKVQFQIFKRFYKSSSSVNGTGIGLAFTQSLIELHHGHIDVESQLGKGACFTMRLPLYKSAYSPSEIRNSTNEIPMDPYDPLSYLSATEKQEELLNSAEGPPSSNSPMPLLLVIDDYQDIRSFIHQSLQGEYQIIEAVDGKQGLQIAQEYMPDMIISDVMMPELDGIELCQTLKSDPKTSHIPLILLTAKTSEESELGGLDVGADDYIRKPFNLDILKVKIRNLLLYRQELKTRFRREVLLEPQEIAVTSADEVFLKKAMDIVEAHMSDPDFSVEMMVKEIGMSRSKLYLKLKALTDQSTSEFIRTVRLKRAVQLLEKSDMTIKEIMYMTGFNTASYFSKCFKKQFGKSPSEYLKESAPVNS